MTAASLVIGMPLPGKEIMQMVTLEEMKNYLRVDYGDDDALIEGMISAAVKQCMDILRTDSEDDLAAAPNGRLP